MIRLTLICAACLALSGCSTLERAFGTGIYCAVGSGEVIAGSWWTPLLGIASRIRDSDAAVISKACRASPAKGEP